ncbi:MAG: hypothetical protein K0R00_411 [Herbinix sp.]|nr:hypothetical protein [Herbinix sp.]
MKITTRRLFSRQRIFLFLCFAVLSFLACTQQVSAEENQKKTYLIKVNRSHNTVTVYEQDKNGIYNVPIKAMICSVGLSGTPTRVGTFRTMAKYRWKLLMGDVWGQYSTRIVGGILFHSVYYYSMNPQTLATNQFNKLGRAASHGCIRLSVADAKWIYDNCDVGTTVTIYDDPKSPGPLGKPEPIKISGNLRWDPTDPNPENPYNKLQPVITGAKNLNTEYGKSIDYLKGIKAKSSLGADITKLIQVEGEIDYQTAGTYPITYVVTDNLGKIAKETINITVKESNVVPEIKGVSDKLVNGEFIVNEKFALEGVELWQGTKQLDQNLIKVKIVGRADKYEVTYSVTLEGNIVTQKSIVKVDKKAPELTSKNEIWLKAGEAPSLALLISSMKWMDNYTESENIKVSIQIVAMSEGTYNITYRAIDEVGNIAVETVTTRQALVTVQP